MQKRPRPLLWLGLGLIVLAIMLCGGSTVWLWQELVGPPPGQGPTAERGYQTCAPIIAALERHAAERGGYPETLAALVPAYLEAVPTADAIDLTYRHTEASYELEFHYAGPGMNVCTYTPEAGWDCYGYY